MFHLIGKMVLTQGYRWDGETRVFKVLKVRDTHSTEGMLRMRTIAKDVKTRGRYAITALDMDRKVLRTYYLEHLDDAKVIGRIGYAWHRLLVALRIREVKA